LNPCSTDAAFFSEATNNITMTEEKTLKVKRVGDTVTIEHICADQCFFTTIDLLMLSTALLKVAKDLDQGKLKNLVAREYKI